MAASFLKRKPKEPDGPQRQEIPVLEADAETGLKRRAGAGAAGRRLGQRAGGVSRRVGPGDHRKKRFYVL